MVGPPPVDDPAQNERISALDEMFRAVSAEAGVPYVNVFGALVAEPRWMSEVRCGDGAHPGAGGYELLADLVLPEWRRWVRLERVRHGRVARPNAAKRHLPGF
ncbi:hypothetical protein PA7_29800 [Pseudonocardia asaccharolytica DSM 44247 = NBRC 16224]|uniref:SGNH hydrolase-type esterase domain-containing protein n=1 Tax=Pseudonocardia asaccharolytica DSM 44247 = NBRC 16224 TaxID=1123024 RepID=A0A511D3Q5_9PSEU|nr:hypothetical protein PA7_29800 [Pseudonocardia asaccharolytica DSM 44247 = NBRC 16224]